MLKSLNVALVGLLSIASLNITAVAAEPINAIKAAELASHRIERLVLQKKIDKSYLAKFQKMIVAPVSNDPSGAAYSATAYQTAPTVADGLPLSLTILLDASGMVLKYTVNEGGTNGADVNWTEKDPVALTEAALHYLIDHQNSAEELKLFASNFQSLSLEQVSKDGSAVAELKVSNDINSSQLVLTLDLSGKVLNKTVIP